MNEEAFFKKLSHEEIKDVNQLQLQSQKKEFDEFLEKYTQSRCYICDLEITSRARNFCLHNLLYRNNPSSKIIERTLAKNGLFPTLTYLSWVSNLNDNPVNYAHKISKEEEEKKFECSFRWENLTWSFSVAHSDFTGHPRTQTDFPHFHYECLDNEVTKTSFGQFHIPLTDLDLFSFRSIDFLDEDAILFVNQFLDQYGDENALDDQGLFLPAVSNDSEGGAREKAFKIRKRK